jgi:hypothetical protein
MDPKPFFSVILFKIQGGSKVEWKIKFPGGLETFKTKKACAEYLARACMINNDNPLRMYNFIPLY